jgi:hypothetical protein
MVVFRLGEIQMFSSAQAERRAGNDGAMLFGLQT